MTDVVDREDVRVVERGCCSRFELEASQPIGVIGECRRKNLDRDGASQFGVARPVHLAHAPGVHERHDFVASQARSGQ